MAPGWVELRVLVWVKRTGYQKVARSALLWDCLWVELKGLMWAKRTGYQKIVRSASPWDHLWAPDLADLGRAIGIPVERDDGVNSQNVRSPPFDEKFRGLHITYIPTYPRGNMDRGP